MPVRAIYISHGAPPLLEEDHPIVHVMKALGKEYHVHPPDLILVASPHWQTQQKYLINSAATPDCIQDYYGFPERYYEYRYDVKGAPDGARQLVAAGQAEGIAVEKTTSWGLDHGAWVPLYYLFPQREIPVIPISSKIPATPREHYQWGGVIAKTAESMGKEILFIGTGSPVHRLDQIQWGYTGTEIYPPGEQFDRELIQLLQANELESLLDLSESHSVLWRQAAPEGDLAPLYLTAGVAGHPWEADILCHQGWYYGTSMIAVDFSNTQLPEITE